MSHYTIDLNADVGEGFATDEALMPFISSANIACGFHAGDAGTIQKTINLCLQNNVAIGAHPSFQDREHFGRKELLLDPNELFDILIKQLNTMKEACDSAGALLHHVKPHGALYNLSAKNEETAAIIARAVFYFDSHLILVGMANSFSGSEAIKQGLTFCSEAFADRRYEDNGQLVNRSKPGALIEDVSKAEEQVVLLATENKVQTISGHFIPVEAQSICLHGDGAFAVSFARQINKTLKERGIQIQSF